MMLNIIAKILDNGSTYKIINCKLNKLHGKIVPLGKYQTDTSPVNDASKNHNDRNFLGISGNISAPKNIIKEGGIAL